MSQTSDPQAGMSVIVKTISRLVASFILLFGIYIVLYGHITPGGGFAGGVIAASGLVLMLLAFGRQVVFDFAGERSPKIWDSLGALAFLLIAVAGYFGGSFFSNLFAKGEPFRLLSAGTIPLSNIAIGVKVSAGLFGVYLALAMFRPAGRSGG
ncbi:MAG: MnhB domain-containing protein [Gemmatimonadota bacterium]